MLDLINCYLAEFWVLDVYILFLHKFLLQQILVFQNLLIFELLILEKLIKCRYIVFDREAHCVLCTGLEREATLVSETVLFIYVDWRVWWELVSYWTFAFFSLIITWKIIEIFLSWAKLSTFNCIPNLTRPSSFNNYTGQLRMLFQFPCILFFISLCLTHFIYLQWTLYLEFRKDRQFVISHLPIHIFIIQNLIHFFISIRGMQTLNLLLNLWNIFLNWHIIKWNLAICFDIINLLWKLC